MDKAELQKLTKEELIKKKKSSQGLIGLFIPIILALSYFTIQDYISNDEMDMPQLTIIICSIGGMVSLFPGLKAIQEELKSREV